MKSARVGRAVGCRALACLGTEGVHALLALCRDAQGTLAPSLRVAAVRAIGEVHPLRCEAIHEAVAVLREASASADPAARAAALGAMSSLREWADERIPYLTTRSVLGAMQAALEDRAPEVRREAARAMLGAGPRGEMVLADIAHRGSSLRARDAALRGLGEHCGTRMLRTVLLSCTDPSAGVRSACADTLQRWGPHRVRSALANTPARERQAVSSLCTSVLDAAEGRALPTHAARAVIGEALQRAGWV